MESKPPVLGILSMALPLLIGALWILFERNPALGNGLNGYFGFFMLAFLYVATFIFMGAGLILAIAALLRGGRGKLLGILGVIGNLGIVLWILG
jgi:hypothetical protein